MVSGRILSTFGNVSLSPKTAGGGVTPLMYESTPAEGKASALIVCSPSDLSRSEGFSFFESR